ncbi:MAG: signal peptidase I [Candidatus Bathyarchaeia archaeon]
MKFTKALGRYRKLVILGIILLVNVLAFWFGFKACLRTEFPLLPVDSTSMRPALNYGDLIVVQGVTDACEINVASAPYGDIIVFRRPNEPDVLVISRVIDKAFKNGAWYLRTQLDTRNSPDWWLSGLDSEDTWGDRFLHEKFLVGKVVSRIPFMGYVPLYISMFIRNPIAMFLMVVAIFLILSLKYPFLFGKKAKPKLSLINSPQ